jgi:proline dehydrogenase
LNAESTSSARETIVRQLLLKASQSTWLRQRVANYGFLRRASRRFLPGETLQEALAACRDLAKENIGSVLTYLGENVTDRDQAAGVTRHYLDVLDLIESCGFPAEVSVKLTQLGLDLEPDFCFSNLSVLLAHCPRQKTLWIDMEQSSYVDATLQLFHLARLAYPHAGICVQAYLHRTEQDVDALITTGAAVRLVKGAYNEPADVAFPKKRDVDENFYSLARKLLGSTARRTGVRAAFATHDANLINRIVAWAAFEGLNKKELEFQMLYAIQKAEQLRLAKASYPTQVLVSYGSHSFPWFMRRLAERPANVLFLARNLISR